ncbi:hypothetical protein HNY73_014094 [Argiope bruennichi]|uniref:Uncharacterized protein n=1 Tax=Argiope bruennichi TaxID=94029 RepID=A0A8T0EMZ6_ARGBR|nr:hypothetical protein HNY73_014094 [Argiope bruennichi]
MLVARKMTWNYSRINIEMSRMKSSRSNRKYWNLQQADIEIWILFRIKIWTEIQAQITPSLVLINYRNLHPICSVDSKRKKCLLFLYIPDKWFLSVKWKVTEIIKEADYPEQTSAFNGNNCATSFPIRRGTAFTAIGK